MLTSKAVAAGSRAALLVAFCTAATLAGCGTSPEVATDPVPQQSTPAAPPPSPSTTSAEDRGTGTPNAPRGPAVSSQQPRATATPAPGRPRPTDPVSITVPRIGLQAEPLIGLGLATDGTMEVPKSAEDVGWFTGGGRPGGPGPTVIAGHVDSRTGPGVFYELTSLKVGDEVSVKRQDGRTMTYRVTKFQDVPKDAFPTEIVFGASSDDELRLITCTGEWDQTRRSHRDNRIVWAKAT